MSKRLINLLGIIVLLSATAAMGQGKQVKVELKQAKVVVNGGVETLQPTDKAKPGDVIEYTATYHNIGKTAVKAVAGDIPVPVGMEYVPDAKLKAPDLAATNDGKFAPLPLKHKVMKNGVQVEEVLPYSEYRILRWNIGTLAPDQKVEEKARVKLTTAR